MILELFRLSQSQTKQMQKWLTSVGVNEGDGDGGDVGNGVGTEIVNVGDSVGDSDGDALGKDVGCGVGTEIMNVGIWQCEENITWK